MSSDKGIINQLYFLSELPYFQMSGDEAFVLIAKNNKKCTKFAIPSVGKSHVC
jgi:hypothetical protein